MPPGQLQHRQIPNELRVDRPNGASAIHARAAARLRPDCSVVEQAPENDVVDVDTGPNLPELACEQRSRPPGGSEDAQFGDSRPDGFAAAGIVEDPCQTFCDTRLPVPIPLQAIRKARMLEVSGSPVGLPMWMMCRYRTNTW